jgi:Asp-tRNA(Asn)/Glu-tRNA(Gln) amidotransferase A subunit family amidase
MPDYDLETLHLPKLSGTGLRLFASALDTSLGRGLLLNRLLRDGGIQSLREYVLEEPPAFSPPAYTGEPAAPDTRAAAENIGTARLPALPFKRIRDYAEAYRNGAASPESVAEKVLQAISASEDNEPPLRAFIAVYPEDVLAQAKASAERIRAGKALSLLDGVPVAIKDEFDMTPYPTTVGTSFLGQAPVASDATAVARLRAAGALLIGKANMHEIGINPTACNVHYGPARNPYNPACDTGGSSSGPSAAVAAGLCPVALGADGGGSIRIPASLCGLVGLKATFGRISEKGAFPLCWSVAHLGPIGASVEDVAYAYALIAGPDPDDPRSLRQPAPRLDTWDYDDLSGLTIGLYRPWFNHAAQPVVAAGYTLLEKFKEVGVLVKEIEIPNLDALRVAHAVTILAEMWTTMKAYPDQWGELGASERATLRIARALTASDYIQAQRVRARAQAAFEAIYRDVDVILTPATAAVAQPIPDGGDLSGWSDLSLDTEMMRYAIPGNMLGYPAITFPAGYDETGLPIGLQAMGRLWEEHVLLRVARVAEGLVERRLPPLHYDILE